MEHISKAYILYTYILYFFREHVGCLIQDATGRSSASFDLITCLKIWLSVACIFMQQKELFKTEN